MFTKHCIKTYTMKVNWKGKMWSEKVQQQEWDDCSLEPVRSIRAKKWKKNRLLFSALKSTFQIRSLSIEEELRERESMSQWFGMPCLSVGFSLLYFFKFIVNTALYNEILEQLMLLHTNMLYGDVDLHFQYDLAPCQLCWSWFADPRMNQLTWAS